MNNAAYGKTKENLGNRIHVGLMSNKRLFKMDIKTKLYVKKIF